MSRKKYQLGELIKKVRNDAGLKQEEFAKSLSVTTNTINRYEKGHRLPDSDFLTRLVNIYNCDPAWLLTGEGEMEGQPAAPERPRHLYCEEGFVAVPYMSGEISAGGGLIPDNTVEMRIAFRREWIERKGDPKNMSLIRVTGDSMEPTLQSGDLILVDHSRHHIDPQGGLYALSMDDTIMIKRMQINYKLNTVKVISDNDRYDSFETATDEIRINGKVIWFGREIER